MPIDLGFRLQGVRRSCAVRLFARRSLSRLKGHSVSRTKSLIGLHSLAATGANVTGDRFLNFHYYLDSYILISCWS